MDELSKIAKAYYQASSANHKKLAQDFFDAMDDDRDGKIDRKEFMKFMSDQRHDQMTKSSFFKQLDVDGSGTLDLVEVMRLYYIVKSGRPFCNSCKMFIPTVYFLCTCVRCLEDEGGGQVHLCLDCYAKQECEHSNNDMSRFLDNYSLLEVMLKSDLSKAKSRPSQTMPNLDNPPSMNNDKWDPFVSMVQVLNLRPPNVNHHSRNQCPPTAALQYPPSRNNHTHNPPFPVVQVSNYPSPIVNHHFPLQYPPSRNNYTWNMSVPMAQVPNMPTLNVNHDSWNQCSLTTPLQVPNIPTSIANHHLRSQFVPSTSSVVPQVHQQTWIQHNYYQPPIASHVIVPERERWQEAFEALNAAFYVGAIGSVLCSIL